jgi:hypothetical protein
VYQDRHRYEQHGGQHEPVPDRDKSAAACIKLPQDVICRFAQYVWVLEGDCQQGKEDVEGDWRQYEDDPGKFA